MALMVSLTACKKDFLNVVPLGDQTASTTDDYDQLMNGPAFYLFSYGGGWQEPALMGDEVAADADYFTQGSVQMANAFQWQASIFLPADREALDLGSQLNSMYACNKIIAEVDGSSGGTDSLKKELKAEAMASRAWLNFQFINYYAKPYLASTASTDPGFPIIDKPNIAIANYTRATVQAVYDFIIKDLTTAVTSLPVKAKIQTRMSRPAVEGLLGKVYLFMGRYKDAASLLQAALADVAAAGVPVLYDYNVTFGPGGSFLPISDVSGPASPGQNYNDLKEAVVSKVFYNGSFAGNFFGNNGLVLDPKAAVLYGPTDWRLLFYTSKNPDGSLIPAGRLRKYGVKYSRCGLQLSELYLLSAECKARTNDLAGARTDVETLRKNRMPVADAAVPSTTAIDQSALIKFIIDERIREFALEGARWFDMRRLSVDPLFAGQTFTHTLYNLDNSTTVYTLEQPNRLTLQIPPSVIGANPGMVNNP